MMAVYPMFLVYVVNVCVFGSITDSSTTHTCRGPGINRSPQRGTWLVFVSSRFVYRWPATMFWQAVSSVRTWLLQYQHKRHSHLSPFTIQCQYLAMTSLISVLSPSRLHPMRKPSWMNLLELYCILFTHWKPFYETVNLQRQIPLL